MYIPCDGCGRLLDYPGSCGCPASIQLEGSPILGPDDATETISDEELALLGLVDDSDNPF